MNSIGLFYDLAGVIFVSYSFRNIKRDRNPCARMATIKELNKDFINKEYKKLITVDRIGMALLVIGFILRIMSNYIKL